MHSLVKDLFSKKKSATPEVSAAAMPDTLGAAQDRIRELSSDVANLQSSMKSREAQIACLCGAIGLTPAEIAGKSSADLKAAVDQCISYKTLDQVAQLGIHVNNLPSPLKEHASGEDDELMREYARISNEQGSHAAAAFYQKAIAPKVTASSQPNRTPYFGGSIV